MKARDIFGAVVRSIGLCLVLFSLWYLFAWIVFALIRFPLNNYSIFSIEDLTAEAVMPGLPSFIIGILFMRFGRQIVIFCYPRGKDDADA